MIRPSIRPSIRRRLAILLAGPLAVLLVISAVVSYAIAVSAAREAYDRSLLDPAMVMSKYLRVDRDKPAELELTETALDALRFDSEDRVYYRIVGPRGEVVAGNAVLPPPPARAEGQAHRFFDIRAGEPLRAVALYVPSKTGEYVITVAETTVKRDALIREVVLASILPEGVVMLTTAILLFIGIRRGLAPLERLREQIAERSPSDLRPVDDSGVPREVLPLVASLNHLLGRLDGAIVSQQQFIGNAAHQLRTPLAGLSAHAELALREPAGGELKRLLAMVHGETRRTTHLVNQLLALARAEPSVAGDAVRAPVDLHDVVNLAATDSVRRAIEKDIDLGFDLRPARMLGEALLLRELVANLLDNAISYTPPKGTITVRTYSHDGSSIVEVEDDGPGIAPELRARVFERFYRVPGTPAEGCGLGLAIVKDIATRHGGVVSLDSGTGGQGTLARATFPRLAAEPEPRALGATIKAAPQA